MFSNTEYYYFYVNKLRMNNFSSKKKILIIILMLIFLSIYFIYYSFVRHYTFIRYQFVNIFVSEMPIVLMWTNYYGKALATPDKSGLRDMSKNCKFHCLFTEDRKYIEDAKLVLFYAGDIKSKDLPSIRKPNQLYVFYNYESPFHSGHQYKKLRSDFFNLTYTYRKDSDLHIPASDFVPISNDTKSDEKWEWNEVVEKVKNKTKLALIIVSNCFTPSGREKYIRYLMKYINVTIRGVCGQNTCDNVCKKNEIDDHLFYLAFENSVCKDYVSEKYWKISDLIVPIVFERKIYENIGIPPQTFIAADDFESPEKLVEHLIHLSMNRTEYLKFFEWTKLYKKPKDIFKGWCDFCYLASTRKAGQVENTFAWWDENRNCIYEYAKKLLPLDFDYNQINFFNPPMFHKNSTNKAISYFTGD